MFAPFACCRRCRIGASCCCWSGDDCDGEARHFRHYHRFHRFHRHIHHQHRQHRSQKKDCSPSSSQLLFSCRWLQGRPSLYSTDSAAALALSPGRFARRFGRFHCGRKKMPPVCRKYCGFTFFLKTCWFLEPQNTFHTTTHLCVQIAATAISEVGSTVVVTAPAAVVHFFRRGEETSISFPRHIRRRHHMCSQRARTRQC